MFASRESRVTVVTHHRIGDFMRIRPARVERCFSFPGRHLRPMRPSELLTDEHRGRVEIVTIDDGHADSYRHVFPIAKALVGPISRIHSASRGPSETDRTQFS